MNTINERIRDRRLELGLSQGELAKESGMSAGAIGNYESGTREPKKTLALSKALKVNREWLETGKGPKDLGHISPMRNFNLSQLDVELLKNFHQISDEKVKNRVIGYVEALVEKQKNMPNLPVSKKTKKAAA